MQELLDRQALKETQGHQAKRVHRVLKELDPLAPTVIKVLQGPQACLV